MAAASSTHVRKRQYQPSIKSYFNRDVSTISERSPLSPRLDADTQASLLSVGMRVRKSVPEGYKTHKTLGIDDFPFPSTAPAMPTLSAKLAYSTPNSKELMPFCGLHKVGGLGAQSSGHLPPSSAPAQLSGPYGVDQDDMPALSMSQNTFQSTQSSVISSRKRIHEDEEEIDVDLDACFEELYSDSIPTQAAAGAARPIAKLKSSVRRPVIAADAASLEDDDFEDASFLAPLEGMEVDD